MPGLTQFQADVVRLFFSLPASEGFLLAGGGALPQREPVVVAGGEVADVEWDAGEALDLLGAARGQEPIGHAPLVEHLEGAGVQPAGAGALDVLVGAPLDDEDVDARQRQLARQDHPRRTATCGHRRMFR